MGFDAEFRSMMPHTIGVKPWGASDAWGNPTFGTLVSYQGRIENKRRKVINQLGEEVISNSTLYLATTAGIGIRDQITLPSGCLPVNPVILAIERQHDESGAHHVVVYV